MEWVRGTPGLLQRDRKVLQFSNLGTTLSEIIKFDGIDTSLTSHQISTPKKWEAWVQENHIENLRSHPNGGTLVVLSGRLPDIMAPEHYNPSLLCHVPFPEETFHSVISKLSIHGSLARTINRGQAIFTRTYLPMGAPSEDAIVYNCRSSQDWPGDLALSITYLRSSKITFAVFFGCDEDTMKKVKVRLRSAEKAFHHPLLLVGVFAELERVRHIELVEESFSRMLQSVSSVGESRIDIEAGQFNAVKRPVNFWLDIYHLRIALEKWKNQLQKIVNHIDELNLDWEVDEKGSFCSDTYLKDLLQSSGVRIKERILEIMEDYDEKICQCQMNMEATTLANSMIQTQTNINIALATKDDSSQMRSIALLTMIFLPATFVASIFSMTFFQWIPEDSTKTVSPKLWIYFVVAAGLTLVTVGLWRFFGNRRRASVKWHSTDVEKCPNQQAIKAN